MPGSDSLTQEEQVSSLTMGGFEDCLFSMDLPALHIPRCAEHPLLGATQYNSSPLGLLHGRQHPRFM